MGVGHDQVGLQRVKAAGRLGRGQEGIDARGHRPDAGRAEIDGHIVDVGGQHQTDHGSFADSSLPQSGRHFLSGLLEPQEAQ